MPSPAVGPRRDRSGRPLIPLERTTAVGIASARMDASADIAERCRRKADECRQMAQRARDPKIKAELLDLAAQWLALAEQVFRRRV